MNKKQKIVHSEAVGIVLSKNDKAILKALEPVAEGIAKTIGNNCEVVIYSLEDTSHSVVKVVNNHITGQKLGDSISNDALEILRKADTLKSDVVGCYYSKSRLYNTLFKVLTILIRNNEGKIIGVLSIGVDLSVSLVNFLQGFIPQEKESTIDIREPLPTNLDELIVKYLDNAIARVGYMKKISAPQKNKLVIIELYNKGLFKITGGIDIVAKNLGISRYTVYNYLREIKGEVISDINP